MALQNDGDKRVNENSGWLVTVLATVAGLVVGFFVCEGRARRAAKQRQLIPKHWPLYSRAIVNTEEHKVWRWLSDVFNDHHIMIKMPVTRFTLSHSRESSRHLNKLLNGVYSTFTVCATDGNVVGCVDVLRDKNLPKENRHMKLTLLSQFGIAYSTINSDNLPTSEEIRFEFLGETKPTPPQDSGSNTTAFTEARENLQEAVDRQRISRYIELSALVPNRRPTSRTRPDSPPLDSEFGSSNWQQLDSFIAPLER